VLALMLLARWRAAPQPAPSTATWCSTSAATKEGVRPVVFPHWFHRIRFRCKVCHQELGFKMRAGANDVLMSDIIDGKFCGMCHNGRIAWGPERCDLCHSGKPRHAARHRRRRADLRAGAMVKPWTRTMRRARVLSAVCGRPGGLRCHGDGAAHARPARGRWLLSPYRALSPAASCRPRRAALGMPARAWAAACSCKLLSPAALALRGNDLLVADARPAASGAPTSAFNTLTPIAGAPVGPGTRSRSAPTCRPGCWTRRRARCCASRATAACCRPGASAATCRRRWPWRWPTAARRCCWPTAWVRSGPSSGARVAGAPGRHRGATAGASAAWTRSCRCDDALYVLDRLAGVVHRTDRDGRVLATLGRGDLVQPVAIAADRDGRVFVPTGPAACSWCCAKASPRAASTRRRWTCSASAAWRRRARAGAGRSAARAGGAVHAGAGGRP
jgi:c(7)-type cytochrome triheme protein